MKTLHVQSWDAYEKAMQEAGVKVAVDAGANDGGYTNTLLEHGFHVFAFEPVPPMYKKLVDRFGSNPDVSLFQLGLGDKAQVLENVTVLEAWSIGHPGLGGLQVSPDFKDLPPFDMTITPLDEILKGAPIGILKLDVDGYEHRVLKGARETLRKWQPPILCELGCYLQKIGDDPREFIEYIFDLGYKIVSMDGRHSFTTWAEVAPQYPHHTTFDVMLLPR